MRNRMLIVRNRLGGRILLEAVVLFSAAWFAACDKKDTGEAIGDFEQAATGGALDNGRPCVPIPVDANGIITLSTLSAANNWLLDGVSYVAPGQTLTIDPGTVIVTGAVKNYSDPGLGLITLAGVLVVPKTAKLEAIGTPTDPILFTTPQRVGCAADGCNTDGEFGGIILLGSAPTSSPVSTRIPGIPQPAGTDLTYGGGNQGDDSGTLRYVRIEFPGYPFPGNSLLNGLTAAVAGSVGQSVLFMPCRCYNPVFLIPSSFSPAFGSSSTFKGAFRPGITPWTVAWTDFNPEFCCSC